jgi:large subunit ribosomal protein L18e
MPKPTGPSNLIFRGLIDDIRTRGYRDKIPFLLKLAEELETPRRSRAEVDLSKLNRVCNDNETIVVPGKLLAAGMLKKKLTVAAASFSMSAVEGITKAGGKTMTIEQLIKNNPKGTDVKIVI